MIGLWNMFKNLVDKDRAKHIYLRLDPQHVDRLAASHPVEAGRHYFRVWLAEMYLRKEVQAFTTWSPAVHSLVRLDFGDQTVEIPNIADGSRVGAQPSATGDVIARNFVLAPALPFNGGTVGLAVGLIALEGTNQLNSFLSSLGTFAGLLNVPQLSGVLGIAQPLASSIQQLFTVGNRGLHIGLQETYAADDLRSGYIIIMRAIEDQVDPARLWVIKDQLREGPSLTDNKPFQGFDYLLLRIEVFEQRDDWELLTDIQTPMQDAIRALGDVDEERASYHMRTAMIRAMQAPELTRVDRRRVVSELKEQFEQAKEDLGVRGAVGEAPHDLAHVMRMAMPASIAIQQGDPTIDEILTATRITGIR